MRRGLALILLAGAPAAALACTPAPQLAVGCVGCHGADAAAGDPPPLHGQDRAALYAALHAYADDDPAAPTVMHRMLAGLDDTTLTALAAHYACDDGRAS